MLQLAAMGLRRVPRSVTGNLAGVPGVRLAAASPPRFAALDRTLFVIRDGLFRMVRRRGDPQGYAQPFLDLEDTLRGHG